MAAPMAATAPQRVAWIDRARGIALCAMIVYHFCFDLSLFGLTPWNVGGAPHWRAFAISIAGSFLFLAGLSLALASTSGVNRDAFLRRLAMVAGAAALVTVGTWAAMPYPVWFGILHAIALFSVLALPFLRAPTWAIVLTAAVILILPQVWQSEVFSSPLLYPIGLDPTPGPTFDYEPIFPWFAPVLLGVAARRVLPLPRSAMATDLLARMGRHSLIIYLLHQPILFGLLIAATRLGLV
ncbi:Acyltransferase family protein [Rhodobacteraceae bacterium THAF1]|uniref:DUF1624 domain-containing protein n=1 Tax=Palleronia sp. THAF1 TaxID=2587842 RepID=UPI000F3D1297|nr:heparan-alpha-glucosaminide N-acetyltransferase [Palleronia sp. THAF1]QFU07883.1 Acyltransferase family protein [Palleronia sp. THAF1]VDC25717.1 Acyltransferase family protein [Rhodobacteraceae bacterium THAF1]